MKEKKHRHPIPSPSAADRKKEKQNRDAALDKTSADSFPTSDPPSTIPDPNDESTTGADDPSKD